jgi:hypothetical protein
MKYELLGKCPVCEKDLKVTELSCKECRTVIKGEFEPCKFCKLTKQHKSFIEVFIKNRGNIKEIEKELAVSYPTVRNKLEEVIEALGYKNESKENTVNRKEILDKLSKGEISKDEALKFLSE